MQLPLRGGTFQRAVTTATITTHHAADLLGAEHPNTLTARAHLAASYYQAGRTSDAIALQEQVLADCQRLLGAEHPHTLSTGRPYVATLIAQRHRVWSRSSQLPFV
ncbi:MAG: tetratricopeptide repeat protein [Actinobacteria bacterium]|nr:tetratricopeptide repeat protein [Actinomycetota bacterium]